MDSDKEVMSFEEGCVPDYGSPKPIVGPNTVKVINADSQDFYTAVATSYQTYTIEYGIYGYNPNLDRLEKYNVWTLDYQLVNGQWKEVGCTGDCK